ncbi:MAG: NTP transferase domain-containing protein [Chitinophagales bacterium]|nr:NTP transferase domain-containing protein [Chitinophagales bacterium]
MKAIIPVAGAGIRLRPHTFTQPKALIPVAGKPILGFIIDQLSEVGVTDFVFVIGYLGEKIKSYVEHKHPEINASFVHQLSIEGLGHAIWMARTEIEENEEIIIVLGDTIVDTDFAKMIQTEHSCLGVKKVSDPRQFGVAEIGDNHLITKVIEKPEIPKSNMALVGVYRIKESAALFDALYSNIANSKKTNEEFQLTDGIQSLIEDGINFESIAVENWYDLGQKEVVLETNATLLKKFGDMSAGNGSFEQTIIIPPVSIGENTKISNSIIGPNVTIGENSNVSYAIIKDSILGDYVNINEVALNESIIGSDASVKGFSHSLNIGDNTEIDLSGE